MTNDNENTCTECGCDIYKGTRVKGMCLGCNHKKWRVANKEHAANYQRKWNRAHGVETPAEAGLKRRRNPGADVEALIREGKTVRELAAALDVTKARVYQIIAKRGLRPLWDEVKVEREAVKE